MQIQKPYYNRLCSKSHLFGNTKSYATVVMDLAKLQCETGYDYGDKPLIDRYLQMHGFLKQKQPKKPNGKKYTGGEFCKK